MECSPDFASYLLTPSRILPIVPLLIWSVELSEGQNISMKIRIYASYARRKKIVRFLNLQGNKIEAIAS